MRPVPLQKAAHDMGARLESLWKARRRKPEAFAELASRCLLEARLHETDLDAVPSWVMRSRLLPKQFGLHNDFGEPSLTLFSSEHFVIELLYWLKPLPNVHDHTFTGAFTVLRGRTLHVTHGFDVQEGSGGPLVFGRRQVAGTRMIEAGEVTAIPWGPGFIHQVWHLRLPSLSLLVRTVRGFYQNHEYQGSALAVNMPSYIRESMLNPPLVKRLQLLRHLAKVEPRRAGAYAAELIGGSDLFGGYLALRGLYESTGEASARERALAAARRRHGRDRAEAVRDAVEEVTALAGFDWEAVPEESGRLDAARAFSGAGVPA